MRNAKFAVIGQGYVGLPLAIAAAKAGIATVGIDSSAHRIDQINSGRSPIDNLTNEELLSVLGKNYQASTDYSLIANCDVISIAVPTPVDESDRPDLTLMKAALTNLTPHLKEDALVIIESTIATGSTRSDIWPIIKASPKGTSIKLAYSPERIDPAIENWNVVNTPKLIAGINEASLTSAINFYQQFIKDLKPGKSVETIEAAKLLENTFRLVNISFINEFANFCESYGIDVREVIDAAASKPYGFLPFYPSAGVGGHCIPVDPGYLAQSAREVGTPLSFVEKALEFNHQMGEVIAKRAEQALGGLAGKKIILIGVAYKPNVSDVRETPASGLLKALRNKGAAVSWHDELVRQWEGEVSSPLNDQYDLAILVNPHKNTDLAKLGETKILDTKSTTFRERN